MLKMKENETINNFSGKISSIMEKFKSLGSRLDEEVAEEDVREEVLVEENEDVEGAQFKVIRAGLDAMSVEKKVTLQGSVLNGRMTTMKPT
nr:hypothetical protein [Tanacetum cinerariifolium]